MATTLILLILEIEQDGVDGLRLLTDRVNHLVIGCKAVFEINEVVEVACRREAVVQETLKDGIAHLYEILFSVLLTILDGVEGIQEHASAETYLHLCEGLAV